MELITWDLLTLWNGDNAMSGFQSIIPGRSIGEIFLKAKEEEVLSKIGHEYVKEERSESCYVYHLRSMMIWISKKTKRVYQISVGAGFHGYYQNRITVGSKFEELESMGIIYCDNETIPVYMIEGIDGICFELEDDVSIDEVEDLGKKRISWISIF